jgi:hypothetical protein
MKKLLLWAMIALSHSAHAQISQLYFNDSLNISSTLYTGRCPIPEDKFEDRTSDGIYFSLAKGSYKMFVPELCIEFYVSCKRECDIGSHLIWLISQMRAHKNSNVKLVIMH